jgi:hypothetical protein
MNRKVGVKHYGKVLDVVKILGSFCLFFEFRRVVAFNWNNLVCNNGKHINRNCNPEQNIAYECDKR